MSVPESVLKNIVTRGKYYYPASSHYPKAYPVICDRCNKTNLSACIGYESYDLCMHCVEKVIKNIEVPDDDEKVLVKMMPSRFRRDQDGGDRTFMMSNKFRKQDDDYLTFMMCDKCSP